MRLPILSGLLLCLLLATTTRANDSDLNQLQRQLEDLQQTLQAPDTAANPALQAQPAETGLQTWLTTLEKQLREQLVDLQARARRLADQQDRLSEARVTLEESVQSLGGTVLLSQVLLELRPELPDIRVDPALPEQIAELRLQKLTLDRQLREQARQQGVSVAVEHGRQLSVILELLQEVLSEGHDLQVQQERAARERQTLLRRLDEQLFWVPSHRPLDAGWLLALPGRLGEQLLGIPWASTTGEIFAGLKARPQLFLPLLLIIAGLLWQRRRLVEQVEALNQAVGDPERDRPWNTPLAVAWIFLQALPVALALALCGLALQIDARGQNSNLGAALLAMAEVWLVFHISIRVLRPDGVAEQHFRWPGERVDFLRRQVGALGITTLVLAGITAFGENRPTTLGDDALGVLVLAGGYLLATRQLFRLGYYRVDRERPLSTGRLLIVLVLAAMPLALFAAVIAGYYYTALKLTARLLDSLFLLLLWQLSLGVLTRVLEVAAQRLSWQRLLRRRDAGEPSNAPAVALDDQGEPELALEDVSQQSMKLLRVLLLSGFLLALYWIWADLITVFAYLDNIVLWELSAAEGESPTAISLRDALAALVILALAILLGRNLPGLLEVSVLSRLQLAQGAAYAITTLLSYVIVSVGLVATLGTLGVSWNKLQWLVAALGVGLGFGLQEIFANFVSGLIILFERPIRIGDVVTVGSQTGVVKRIRIRATTISDFDRKDIIIPNKVFITGELTNWSLTDSVIRVIIKVGVAYGSDLPLTRELLEGITRDNPLVLDTPPPQIYFLGFGASTLDHEVRVHVDRLEDRFTVIDGINREIDRRFRENGVEIAFNQVDVHVRSITGQELQVATRATGAGPAA